MSPKKTKAAKAAAKSLFRKDENAYTSLKKTEERKLEAYCRQYMDFLSQAKTERKAHDLAVLEAKAQGFQDMDELRAAGTALAPGAKVYRSCRGKTLFLAVVGNKPLAEGMHLVGGHTDAPRLDAKPNPIYEDSEMVLLDTHYYGGIKKYQWVAMPLALHGVVVKPNGDTVAITIGEDLADPVFVITDLLPHLGKDQAAKKLSEGISGEGLNILLGSRPDTGAGDDVKEKVKSR
ncbi:MAG: aminopeptidase, partial [Victivallales bacterium]|nr:aminopeptidase [Victivallales bacterium]